MEHKLQGDNNRPSYFSNVKNRLRSKFPAGVSHLPEVPMAAKRATDGSGHRRHPATGRPLDHVPHIRNPKLRQYYLQGDSLEVNITTEEELKSGQPVDRGSSEGVPEDTVFSITSQVHVNSAVSAGKTKETCAPKGRKTEASSLSELNLDSDPKLWLSPESENAQISVTTRSASPYSISPEAEYDKLLDVETVPLPDGQLCLLTLPPECSRGEGAEALPYLKLLCRYITDCKGVVSGILLVTSNKIFFDPCKTHPLVMEHGWEDYLLSCSVDCVASVSFFSDISHVYIDSAQHRWKSKKSIQKSKRVHKGEPLSQPPPLESATTSEAGSGLALSRSGGAGQAEERLAGSPLEELQGQSAGALPASVLSNAATLCGAGQQGAGTRGQAEPLPSEETGIDLSVKSQAAACRLSSGSPGGLMFVRMRVQQSAGKKKGLGGLMLGTAKAMTRRDVWLALSQESSDELYAYLSQWRPDLCIFEGEGEGDGDEGDFVLIDDSKEEVKDDIGQRCRCPGEDWELVSMEDSVDKQSVVLDRDPEYLTDVVKESCILEASHVIELYAELPPRTIGHTWQLSYSTSRHGSSLKSLYRKLSNTDSPTLIVIKDALDQMFGSFLSHPLRPSETFYGTGETFLFMLHPRFKCFRWTGENTFFIKGDLDSFAIGGGSGHFGLWLDETLCLGRSSPCYTFNNCCLSETDDFRIMELEVWTFT